MVAAIGILPSACAVLWGDGYKPVVEEIKPLEDWMARADSSYEKGDFARAAFMYRKAAEQGQQSAVAWFNVANCMVRLERKDEAKAAYRQSLREAPLFLRAHQNLAALYQLDEQLVFAAKHYQEAARIDSTDVNSLFRLGELSQKMGYADDAIRWYQSALKVDPKEDAAWSGIVQSWLMVGDTVQALLWVGRYNERDVLPKAWALVLQGDLQAAQGRHADAVELYEDAMLADSTDRRPWLRIARSLREMERSSEAAAMLQQAADRFPDDGTVWAAIGNLRFESGDPLGARDAFGKALRLGSADGAQGLEMLSQWHERRGEESAARAAKEAITLN